MRRLVAVWLCLMTGSALALDPYPVTINSQSETAPPITLYRASERTLQVSVTDGADASDLTGLTPWACWATGETAVAVSTASVSVVSATGGVFNATFSAASVNYAAGRYIYEIGIKDGNVPTTVRHGTLIIRGSPYATGAGAITWTTNLTLATVNIIGTIPLANLSGITTSQMDQTTIDLITARTNTTYTAGTNLDLNGTEFNLDAAAQASDDLADSALQPGDTNGWEVGSHADFVTDSDTNGWNTAAESDPVFEIWRTNSAAGTTNAVLPDGSLQDISSLLGGGGSTYTGGTNIDMNVTEINLDASAVASLALADTALQAESDPIWLAASNAFRAAITADVATVADGKYVTKTGSTTQTMTPDLIISNAVPIVRSADTSGYYAELSTGAGSAWLKLLTSAGAFTWSIDPALGQWDPNWVAIKGHVIGTDIEAHDTTLTDIADGTINENLVNTAHPWAINEGGTGTNTAAGARSNLGLVAGGGGDIWVKKAGDVMTGDLVVSNTTGAPTFKLVNSSGDYVDYSQNEINWYSGNVILRSHQGTWQVTDTSMIGFGGLIWFSASEGVWDWGGVVQTNAVEFRTTTGDGLVGGAGGGTLAHRTSGGTSNTIWTSGNFDTNVINAATLNGESASAFQDADAQLTQLAALAGNGTLILSNGTVTVVTGVTNQVVKYGATGIPAAGTDETGGGGAGVGFWLDASGAQAITSTVHTVLQFDVLRDTSSLWNGHPTNRLIITSDTAGWWGLTCGACPGSMNDQKYVELYLWHYDKSAGVSNVLDYQLNYVSGAGSYQWDHVAAYPYLDIGDEVWVRMRHNQGTTLTIHNYSNFSGTKQGADGAVASGTVTNTIMDVTGQTWTITNSPGASGDVLKAKPATTSLWWEAESAGATVDTNAYYCSVYANSEDTVDTTSPPVKYDAEHDDPQNIWNTTTYRGTVPATASGVWSISAGARVKTPTASRIYIHRLYHYDVSAGVTNLIDQNQYSAQSNGDSKGGKVCGLQWMDAGDQFWTTFYAAASDTLDDGLERTNLHAGKTGP